MYFQNGPIPPGEQPQSLTRVLIWSLEILTRTSLSLCSFVVLRFAVSRLRAGTTRQSAERSEPALESLAGRRQPCLPSRSHLVQKLEERSAASDTPRRELAEFAANLWEERERFNLFEIFIMLVFFLPR